MPIKVLIADDHHLFRQGLSNLIGESPDIQIVGQAENGKDAIIKAESLKPDVILMDIAMPGMNGIDATEILQKTHPEIRIIALSMHSDIQYIKEMLGKGAMGYFFKNGTFDQLIQAINQVYAGKRYLSSDITETLIKDFVDGEKEIIHPKATLTERELEVLKLMAEGESTKEISDKLFISIKTIGSHKQKILEKLDLKTNADLIKYAIRQGLVSLK